MKKFLLTAACFAFGLPVTFAVYACVRFYIGIEGVRKEFTLHPDTSVVSISDSHGLHALDESVFPGLQKFSQHSIANWQSPMRLDKILSLNPGHPISAAVFTLSTHTFYRMGFSRYHAKQFAEILPLSLQETRFWPYKNAPVIFAAMCRHPGHPFQMSGFNAAINEPQNESLFETKPDAPFVQAALDRHYPENENLSKNEEGEKQYKRIYSDLIHLCDEHHILPVFVTTPVHARYREKVPLSAQKALARFRKYLEGKGAVCFDFWEWPMDDSEFYDGDHLSLKGRRRFTRHLKELLSALPAMEEKRRARP